jgi:transcriptional regulator with XRE-family HTH domain
MPRKKQKGPKPGTLFKDVQRTAVGMNITTIRRRRGITQHELADKTGLDKTTISYYERKAIAIPLEKIQKIAHVLQVPTDALINGKSSPVDLQVGKPLLKRFEKAKTLPQDKQKLIIDLIDNLSKK